MVKRGRVAKRKTTRKPRKAKATRRVASARASAMPVSERVDRDLADRAVEKQQAGETPTARELSALRGAEKRRDEALRAEHYANIPQGDWVRMSGRQRKVIVEQAEKYGLPIGGKTINLGDTVKAWHDFLAANARRLAAGEGGNGTLQEQKDKVDLETKSLRNERERMQLGEKRGLLIERKRADADRLAIVKLFVGVLEIAGSELSSQLAGRKPAEIRKLVEAYFHKCRCEIEAAAGRGT